MYKNIKITNSKYKRRNNMYYL